METLFERWQLRQLATMFTLTEYSFTSNPNDYYGFEAGKKREIFYVSGRKIDQISRIVYQSISIPQRIKTHGGKERKNSIFRISQSWFDQTYM